jgi:hypothetical protein
MRRLRWWLKQIPPVHFRCALEGSHRAWSCTQNGDEEVVTRAGLATGRAQNAALGTIPSAASDPAVDLAAADVGGESLADAEESVVDGELWVRFEHLPRVATQPAVVPWSAGSCG